jgi:hypothetical protein
MSILTTQEQIEFLLYKHDGLDRAELAKVIAERVDQHLATVPAAAAPLASAKPGGGWGDLLGKIGQSIAESQKQQTREHAARLSTEPGTPDPGELGMRPAEPFDTPDDCPVPDDPESGLIK